MADDLDFSSISIAFIDHTASLEERLEAVERKLLWVIRQTRSESKPKPVSMTTAENTIIAQQKPKSGYWPVRPTFSVDFSGDTSRPPDQTPAQTRAQVLINRIRMRAAE
jgi:hypothetical protein